MLNLFPIQFLSLLAYAALRVIVGFVLISLGLKQLRHREVLGEQFSGVVPFGGFFAGYLVFFEMLIGTLFVLGLATQVAAILGMVLSLKCMYLRGRVASPHLPERLFWAVIFGCSLSLCITGAGAFAFDLPI